MSGKKLINHQTTAGFTLIELLVVVSLSVMLMLSASALFLTFLISNTKTSSTQMVKAEGEYAINQLEFLIRNSTDIITDSITGEQCEAGMNQLIVKSFDGGITAFFAEEDADGKYKIASNSGTYLTSGAVELLNAADGTGITFDCQRVNQDTPYVTVSFTLRKGTPGIDADRDVVTQTFSTSVSTRSIAF
ncbi:MAG: prepilin-type N-terminal cleavage/methylation domain-containing protein [bacterium]|nr:prepilin-type N-terminal cleavage/methylation domain-containing protein [bacterium]